MLKLPGIGCSGFVIGRVCALACLFAVFSSAHSEGPREALVVGLSSYATNGGLGMSSLPSPAQDAERLGARLGALGWKVTVLVSRPEATASAAEKERILESLRGMGKDPEGMVLFAYSGHGYRSGNRDYLCGFDTRFEPGENGAQLVKSSLIDVETDLGTIFRKMPARRRIMIVDACRDEPSMATKSLQVSQTLSQKSAEVVGLSELGSVYSGVLFSCSPGEVSFDDPRLNDGKGASVFIEGVLDAIKNPSGELLPETIGKRAAAFVSKWKSQNGETATKGGRKLKELTLRPQWRPSPENDLSLAFSMVADGGGGSDVTVVVSPAALRSEGIQLVFRNRVSEARPKLREAAERGDGRAMAWLGYMAQFPREGEVRYSEAISWYRKAAEAKDPFGMYWLGLCYDLGRGTSTDAAQASKWFEAALPLLRQQARQDDADSCLVLGHLLGAGRGVAQDTKVALSEYRKAAELGQPFAMGELGTAYLNGTGLEQSDSQALYWLRRGAEAGHPYSACLLGWMCEVGRGVTRDAAEGAKWYRQSAESGEPQGMYYFGRMLELGSGVSKDESAAYRWYLRGANLGEPRSMNALGALLQAGRGVPVGLADAAQWYRKSADLGNATAMNNLGLAYENGRGVARSEVEAVKWYQKAEAGGEPWGANNLGTMYERGAGGLSQDFAKALSLFRKGADGGSNLAMKNLGYMYRYGRGVTKNMAEAVKWYRKAADAGESSSMCELGIINMEGEGVVKDDDQALVWFRKGAEANHPLAMAFYGFMLELGRGTAKNEVAAATWYRKAADLGESTSMNNLAQLYESGRGGLTKNLTLALEWYRKAAAAGSDAAKQNLKRLGEGGGSQ